jgi:hypothetical protein
MVYRHGPKVLRRSLTLRELHSVFQLAIGLGHIDVPTPYQALNQCSDNSPLTSNSPVFLSITQT